MAARRKSSILKTAGIALTAVLLFVYLVPMGVVRVGPDEIVVADGILPGTPRVLEPGWNWCPPLARDIYPYPARNLFVLMAGQGDLRTPDGTRADFDAEIEWTLDRDGALDYHRTLGPLTEEGSLGRDVERQVRGALAAVPDPLGTGRAAAEERIRQRVGGVLDRAGVEVQRFDVTLSVRQQAAEGEAAGRILLVGLDALDWRIADPLIGEGRMPNLEALVARGARGRLRSMSPMLSPVVWTSMVTGVEPHRHGILDFVAPGPDGKPRPVTSNLRRVPALWNLLSDRGLSVGFVAWWATWPAEPVHGVMVSDRLSYTLFGLDREEGPPSEALVYPEALSGEMEALRVEPSLLTVAELERFIRLPGGRFPDHPDDLQRIDEARRAIAAARTYEAVALRLLETREFRLFGVFFEATDTMAHLFMPFHPPRRDDIDPERFEMFRHAVAETYAWHDEILGRLIEAVDPEETTIVVVSDHGFRTDLHRPVGDARIGHGRAAEWHRRFGVIAMAGPAVRSGAAVREAGILDVPPTLMAILGLPVAEDWPGRVLEAALDPAFLTDHPVSRIASYGERGGREQQVALPSAADEALMEKLAALGYVSAPAAGGREETAGGGETAEEPGGRLPFSLNNEGSAFMAAGRLREAEKSFRRALEAAPDFHPARTNLGLVLMMQGRLEEARDEIERAHAQTPERAGLMALLGNVEARLGDAAAAEDWYRKALEAEPNHTDALNSLALLLEEQGRLKESAEAYSRAVQVDPDFVLGWNNLGNLAKRRGRRDEAARHYRRAIEADPAFIGSYNNLGLLFQEEGRFDEAIDLYREALERAPGHVDVRNNLASLYHQTGRYDEAAAEYRRLIEEAPLYAEASNNLGVLLGEMGDRQAEMEQYRRAIQIRPDYSDALHNLGLALMRAGDLDEAAGFLVRALESEPRHVSARRNLAILELQRGRGEDALRVLEDGIELMPQAPALHTVRALVLAREGRAGEACASLDRALALDPGHGEAVEARSDLGCP